MVRSTLEQHRNHTGIMAHSGMILVWFQLASNHNCWSPKADNILPLSFQLASDHTRSQIILTDSFWTSFWWSSRLPILSILVWWKLAASRQDCIFIVYLLIPTGSLPLLPVTTPPFPIYSLTTRTVFCFPAEPKFKKFIVLLERTTCAASWRGHSLERVCTWLALVSTVFTASLFVVGDCQR